MGAPVAFGPQGLQVNAEIESLASLLRAEGVRSLLEIGSKFGGSLWALAKTMPAGSRIVSVDLPNGTRAWKESKRSLLSCVASLRALGHDVHLIFGDSTQPGTIDNVAALGPFDACFIDANHTLPFVTRDWKNYGPMCRMVAFHDIAWRRAPDWSEGMRIDVPELWNEIKGGYRHQEFKACPTGKNNGIGVLWMR